ncbi:MAG: crossover junction endodeoxyribonuclease RuvC [Eubacteriales bacterium]
MIILGIDPGLAIIGYGVIKYDGQKLNIIDYGTITTAAGVPLPRRLSSIYDSMASLIEKFKPDAIAFEELFFNKNVKTALTVGHARGTALVCAEKSGTELFEYTPLQVKQAVCGYGRADKKQVQAMVKMLLNLREIPRPDDAADAVAVAICHAHSSKFKERFAIK